MATLRLLPLLLLFLACDPPSEGAAPAGPQSEVAAAPEPAPTTGMDSALLAAAVARADSMPRLHSFLVWRQGEMHAEQYYNGRGPNSPANIKSASKNIIATLIGIAIAEGHLEGVDQPIAPLFEEYRAGADPRLGEVTLGHLLSMQAGLQATSGRNYGAWVTSPNWVRYAITRPMVEEPGGRMQYSTGTSHLLSAILVKATGMSTLQYAREKLAGPLGFDLLSWTTDPQGIHFGGNEMRMTPRQLLRFGELFLAGGEWEGEQIVPREWIETSWLPRTQSRYNTHRYGYGWWIRESNGHPVYFAWGYGGQYLFLVPDLELMAVTTSVSDSEPRDGRHLRDLHDLLDDYLVPAALRGAGSRAD